MRSVLLLGLALAISHLCLSQSSVSLEAYCPKAEGQFRATCFAYATTYTALSIMHNLRNNATHASEKFVVFSDDFVASKIKQGKCGLVRVFNRCGRYATAESALGVLLTHGTPLKTSFPEGCHAAAVNDFMTEAIKYRIRDTAHLFRNGMTASQRIDAIKQALKANTPVIAAVLQDERLAALRGEQNDIDDGHNPGTEDANHVFCIVGFDDNRLNGSFLVKNNYLHWGKDGFSYIPYNDLIKFLRETYTMEL